MNDIARAFELGVTAYQPTRNRKAQLAILRKRYSVLAKPHAREAFRIGWDMAAL